jgi:FlaA1/EpsC-like NDP-sugar epimerase
MPTVLIGSSGAVPIELEARVLGRTESRYALDLAQHADAVRHGIADRRVLVIGGAGSIGSSTVGLLADLAPACLHVVDIGENYLAELVRELRSRPQGLQVSDFRALPLDYGGPIMQRFLAESAPYHVVLNFAALKHVRSEKDIFSLLQMLDTNVVRHVRFKRWLSEYGHNRRYFAVSTDKAANPTSLMGASKSLMEDVVFDVARVAGDHATSARFANVAFSNGSLLQAMLTRLAKRQPLAVPRATRRYFVSQREAGDICLVAALLAPAEHIIFPRLDPRQELILLEDVVCAVLDWAGLQPEYYEDEDAARGAVESAAAKRAWPVLLTPLDTSGEKPYEEFIGAGEHAISTDLPGLDAIGHRTSGSLTRELFEQLERLIENPHLAATKEDIVAALCAAIPGFDHRETGKSLDQRL